MDQTRRLEELGFGPFFAAQYELLGRPDLVPARVASRSQGLLELVGCGARLGELSGRLRFEESDLRGPAVGDWVAVADGQERAILHHVFDRRAAMIRRAAGTSGRGQVVAANVDLFFIVTSANRDCNAHRVERYLTAIHGSGGRPVVVLNKIDLAGDFPSMAESIERVSPNVPVVRASALTGEGVSEMLDLVQAGLTVGFVGSSGVGKSTLINRLLGQEALRVGAAREDGKGRHTTTRRQLVELPGRGVLIDTPGMRELGLFEDEGGVQGSFPDVAGLAAGCRFGDCRHMGEPGCAVTAAVTSGRLEEERLESYHKLRREIAAAERRRDPALAGREKRRWKVIE
jgi:ribosome biogenesis GTPase